MPSLIRLCGERRARIFDRKNFRVSESHVGLSSLGLVGLRQKVEGAGPADGWVRNYLVGFLVRATLIYSSKEIELLEG